MAKITRLTLDQTGGLDRRRLHLREISDNSEVPLETVGQDLRAARLRKGDDLATIAGVLRIRTDHLEALEESNFDQIPGRAYTIGFVRAYAQYLGMNPGECVDRLKAEIAGRHEVKEPVTAPPLRESRLPPGGIALAVFLAIAVIYVVYYVVAAVGHMRTPPVTPVPAHLSQITGSAMTPPPGQGVARVSDSAQLSGRVVDSTGNNL